MPHRSAGGLNGHLALCAKCANAAVGSWTPEGEGAARPRGNPRLARPQGSPDIWLCKVRARKPAGCTEDARVTESARDARGFLHRSVVGLTGHLALCATRARGRAGGSVTMPCGTRGHFGVSVGVNPPNLIAARGIRGDVVLRRREAIENPRRDRILFGICGATRRAEHVLRAGHARRAARGRGAPSFTELHSCSTCQSSHPPRCPTSDRGCTGDPSDKQDWRASR
jgi:hypothetical protein